MWFSNLPQKHKHKFIQADIENFYGNIADDILKKALEWAAGITVITDIVLPNIYKFPLTELPENESYSGHGDDHTSNFS